jgi:enoyl-[acyl-carrier protein] reductase II
MFQGDLTEGELEIGQASGLIDHILPAGEIVRNIVGEFDARLKSLGSLEGLD